MKKFLMHLALVMLATTDGRLLVVVRPQSTLRLLRLALHFLILTWRQRVAIAPLISH